MPLNPDAVGASSDPVTVSWTSKDALLYAVAIGAGTDELSYATENTDGVAQQVFPTFPVTVGWGANSVMSAVGPFDHAMLLHGNQAVTLHQPLPAEAEVTLQSTIAAMYDKGKAAVVVVDTVATDTKGAPMYTTRSGAFIRGEGGFGGDRGPSGPVNVPPDRAPDHVVTYQTLPEQALIYRLTGDRNPLHSDPAFAARGGFDRPILHGLCFYGFTGRALVHALCGGESARFQHIEGRFSASVYPGEELTVRVWVDGHSAVFTTSVADRVVIDQGLARFS
jgi:acyl dehydratase